MKHQLRKMKSYTIYIAIMLIGLYGCEREKDIVFPDATVEVLNYDGNAIIQEPDGEIQIDIYMQSLAGVRKLDVLLGGQLLESVEPEDTPLSYSHLFTYNIPSSAVLGDAYELLFQMTDGQGRIAQSVPVKISVNYPFEVGPFEFEGVTYERVKGRVNRDLALTKDKKWLLDSIVVIDEGAVLSIEAGTTVYFRPYDNNTLSLLSIARGSRIHAVGTRTEPIVFTSTRVHQNTASRGDWGGVLLHGEAPSNVAPSVLYGGFRYGGNKPADNSGSLRFVRIEYSGKNSSTGTQLHGLQLFGVGSATNVEYVQVYESFNTGFRVRGGRVSLRYLAGIEHGGYGIWADEGWQGNGQFWLFQTSIKATLIPVNYWNIARSIEFRNDDALYDKQPRTTFKVSNVTAIGNGYQASGDFGTRRGIRIRTGASGFLHNAIVTNFPGDGVSVEDLPLNSLGVTTTISHLRVYNNATNWAQDASFFLENSGYNLTETAVPGISVDNFDGVATGGYNPTSLGSWFQNAAYIGAVDPANDWTKGGVWFKDKNGNFR